MFTAAPISLPANLRRITKGSLVLVAGAALLLTGCGPATSSGATAPQGAASQGAQPNGGFGPGGNFVTGLIADVSGKTLQVQSTDAQTAVTYTSKTRFSEQTTVTSAAVKAGSCVMVQSSGTTDSTAITATNVSVSAAVKGECAGRGGFGGLRPGGRPSGLPSGAPGGQATAAPQGGQSANPQPGQSGARNGANRPRGVFGKVGSVSGSTFTVASTAFGTAKSQTYTVTTTAKTTFTEEKVVRASAVKVGKCATAAGKTDSTGAVTATTIALRPAVGGKCTFGAGRAGGRRGNG
jgi:hypothetical protein